MSLANKIFLFVFAMIILSISMANYTFGQHNNPDKKQLAGIWECKTPGYSFVLKILENNQLVFDGENSAYVLVPGAIRVYDEYGGAFDYQYTLNEGKLSVSFPDGNQYVFLKQKASPATKMNTNSAKASNGIFGSFCHYSSSSGSTSSYSTTQSLYFDGKGNFAYGSESAYSGDNGIYSGSSGNGRNFSGKYKLSGKTLSLIFNDSSNYELKVTFIQQSGEITEIVHDGTLYAKALCE